MLCLDTSLCNFIHRKQSYTFTVEKRKIYVLSSFPHLFAYVFSTNSITWSVHMRSKYSQKNHHSLPLFACVTTLKTMSHVLHSLQMKPQKSYKASIRTQCILWVRNKYNRKKSTECKNYTCWLVSVWFCNLYIFLKNFPSYLELILW